MTPADHQNVVLVGEARLDEDAGHFSSKDRRGDRMRTCPANDTVVGRDRTPFGVDVEATTAKRARRPARGIAATAALKPKLTR